MQTPMRGVLWNTSYDWASPLQTPGSSLFCRPSSHRLSPNFQYNLSSMPSKANASSFHLICYSWEHLTIVHDGLSLDDVANGLHKRCGKRIAILKQDYDPDDIQMRRTLQQLKITRWYQIQNDSLEPALEIGVLPVYPDPADYLKELKRKYKLRE